MMCMSLRREEWKEKCTWPYIYGIYHYCWSLQMNATLTWCCIVLLDEIKSYTLCSLLSKYILTQIDFLTPVRMILCHGLRKVTNDFVGEGESNGLTCMWIASLLFVYSNSWILGRSLCGMLVLFSVLCALFLSEDITYSFFTSLLVPTIFSLFFFLQVVEGYYMVINVFLLEYPFLNFDSTLTSCLM